LSIRKGFGKAETIPETEHERKSLGECWVKFWVWVGKRARRILANKEEVANLSNWARNPG